jgi:hypothetical protein
MRIIIAAIALCIMAISGCGTSPPEIVPVTGVVTINGDPLANAEVRFMPMADGLDGNFVASGISDKSGAFTLHLQGKPEPGCCACECKVLVVEGPIPGDTRGQDERSLMAAANFKKKLKNRPIPEKYHRVGTSPLSFTVSAENKEFEVKLAR